MIDATTEVSTPAATLVVETEFVEGLHPLLPHTTAENPLVFLRRGEGIVGAGTAVRLEFRGAHRLADAAAAWRRIAAAAHISDPVALPGTGLVAFGSFAFANDSTAVSVLVVPEFIWGRRGSTSWVTSIRWSDTAERPIPAASEIAAVRGIRLRTGALSETDFRTAVRTAIAHIGSGSHHKVVIARDLVGEWPSGADKRALADALAARYPDCWTFAVDGVIGASPEMLVRVQGGRVSARVLAGSTARGSDPIADERSASALASSTKDLDEHQFALRSVLSALAPHSPAAAASEEPFTLKLPNLWHLASDVAGELVDGSTSLDLLAALHPTAAVAGTPTAAALELIAELEPFDRGRYAAPVGWVGADGDGEWAIALRCASIDPAGAITAFAGAGIVADSVAEHELAETELKFRPIVEALE